ADSNDEVRNHTTAVSHFALSRLVFGGTSDGRRPRHRRSAQWVASAAGAWDSNFAFVQRTMPSRTRKMTIPPITNPMSADFLSEASRVIVGVSEWRRQATRTEVMTSF